MSKESNNYDNSLNNHQFNIDFPIKNIESLISNNSSTNFNSNNINDDKSDLWKTKISNVSNKYEKYKKLTDLINNENVVNVKLYKIKEKKQKTIKNFIKNSDCRMSFNQPKIYMSEREEVYLYNNVSFNNNLNLKSNSKHHETISNFNIMVENEKSIKQYSKNESNIKDIEDENQNKISINNKNDGNMSKNVIIDEISLKDEEKELRNFLKIQLENVIFLFI